MALRSTFDPADVFVLESNSERLSFTRADDSH